MSLNKLFYCLLVMVVLVARIPTLAEAASTPSENFVALVEETKKATVVILTHDETGTMASQGSGFVVDPDGTIVTNVHVLEKATSALVKFSNGLKY